MSGLIDEPSVIVPGWLAREWMPMVAAWAKQHRDHGSTSKLEAAWPTMRAMQDAAALTSASGFRSGGELDVPAPSPHGPTLSTTDAASRLDCDPRWVRELCRNGTLDATRDGRDWRIDPASIDRYRRHRQGE